MQGIALYSRVASRLKGRILNGEWQEGHAIPAIPALCQQYGVGTITIRQALAILASEGLVNSQRGRGTIVTKSVMSARTDQTLRKAINDPLELGPEQSIKPLQKERVKRLPDLLGGDGDYVHIKKLHIHRDTPFALIDIYVAASAFDQFPKGSENRRKIGSLLRDFSDAKLVSMKQELTIVPLEGEAEQLLQADGVGNPLETVLVRILKWWRDDKDRLVFASENYYRSDMFVLDIERDVSDFFRESSPGLIPRPIKQKAKIRKGSRAVTP